jgi:hypothetical protein|tara:strand:+ start:3540 stop:3794 length:255 start_codon:yes stop_codon:yes gene_type:complete
MNFRKVLDGQRKQFFNNKTNPIKEILAQSKRATCGVFEKEVVVPNHKVAETKIRLKRSGFIIVGTGRAGPNTTKVWFNPAGVNL